VIVAAKLKALDGRRHELANVHAELVAVVEAAERVVVLEYDPKRGDAENEEIRRRADVFRAAFVALNEALS
jgi:hypothetical protein